MASVAEEVRVEAGENASIAAQLASVKAPLDAASARTEITNLYIRNFASPVTDFTDVVQAAPGTFSVSPNGIGLGQANTFYRGFADGDYTITYDGIPFEDTNTPSHHSWAFFPGPTLGGALSISIAARGRLRILDRRIAGDRFTCYRRRCVQSRG